MYKLVFDSLTKMFRYGLNDKNKLGRWNLDHCSKIKSQLANYDNCGDKICNDPKIIKEMIKKEK